MLEIPLQSELYNRLRKGERVVLFGRRGAGKSTLVAALGEQLRRDHIPCGHAIVTEQLNDITRALEQAYPTVNVSAIRRRTARARLWLAADKCQAVLLLDHIVDINNAMAGFLRRLVGGIAGVLLVLDVDTPRERAKVRPGRLGGLPLQMPPFSSNAVRSLLRSECGRRDFPSLDMRAERQLVRAALGRPGWIARCVALAEHTHYWREGRLALTNLLCADTEIALRYGAQALAQLDAAGRVADKLTTNGNGPGLTAARGEIYSSPKGSALI
ncbi:MAG TPA: ATP-binding protein [Steroidobacteraceae bacterium]|nr:ATP-binding protein [Steroidobacteraceae bacterium]